MKTTQFAFSVATTSILAAAFPALLAGCSGGSTSASTPNSFPDVKSLATQIRSETKVPALAGAVVSGDTIRLASVGVRRAGAPTAVADGDLWSLASGTKPITSALAARLVEAGLIRFDQTLAEAFPDVRVHPDLTSVTLRQLLGHRSGLATYYSGEDLLSAARFTGTPRDARKKFAEFLLPQKPEFEVGSFHYSNAGYAIAGAMLENAANDSWENLLKTRLLSPLGVNSVKYNWPAAGFTNATNPPQPWGHLEDGDNFIPSNPNDPADVYNTPIPALSPSGTNLSLNIGDFARTVQLHLRGLRGQNGLLKAETIAQLHTPLSGGTYAQGWDEVTIDGQKVAYCDGSNDLFFVVAVIVPGRNLAAVTTTNTGDQKGAGAAYDLAGKLVGIANFRQKIAARN